VSLTVSFPVWPAATTPLMNRLAGHAEVACKPHASVMRLCSKVVFHYLSHESERSATAAVSFSVWRGADGLWGIFHPK
jgi:hypothetical protein